MDNDNTSQNIPINTLAKRDPANNQLARLQDLHHQASYYITQAKSKNTWKAYKSDWHHFQTWCKQHNASSLPATPETIVFYITDLADTAKTATIQRKLVAIGQYHRGNKLDDPTKSAPVKECWKGLRRAKGTSQTQKSPVLIDQLKEILFQLPETTKGIRDKALLLIGLCAGFRRSELVSLNLGDVRFVREGMILTLRKSKTDQEQRGRDIGLPYARNPYLCPIQSLKAWLELADIKKGAIFRRVNRHGQVLDSRLTDQSIALIIKQYVEKLGLDSAGFAGHSLRAGLVTSLALAGLSESAIMRQSGHKSSAVLRRYIRHSELFKDNAIDKLGL